MVENISCPAHENEQNKKAIEGYRTEIDGMIQEAESQLQSVRADLQELTDVNVLADELGRERIANETIQAVQGAVSTCERILERLNKLKEQE